MRRPGSSQPVSRTDPSPPAGRSVAAAWPTLAVVALLVLAGCSGGPATPTTDATTTTVTTDSTHTTPAQTGATTQSERTTTTRSERTTTDGEPTTSESVSIPVNGNGTLGFDHEAAYVRTMQVLGRNGTVDPPSQIYLYAPETPWEPTVTDPFAQTLLDARRTTNVTGERHDGLVLSLSGTESRSQRRFTVVHEYVHNAQFASVTDTPAWSAMFADDHQRHRAAGSLVEGSASYVALAYATAYTNRTRAGVLAENDYYRNASPAGKYAWAPYHFGRQYVAARADSPADHWRLYENPPRTTEEVIHGLAPGSEPPAPLSVTVETDDWTVADRETRGEMFARVVLTSELAESRAARGADGWGNDELVMLEDGDRRAFAWTLRWDDEANATEFVDAFGAAMDARGSRTDGVWTVNGTAIRLERVSAETVVVATGPASFVESLTVDATDGNVTVDATL